MISAIIVAAGKGTRMGPNIDKLFLEVAGRPLVAHTWERFDRSSEIDELILVVRDGMQSEFETLANQYGFSKPYRFAVGGRERQDSVWNGLQALTKNCQWVAIQDGARPCTSLRVIQDVLNAAKMFGAAVAAQKVTDTLKETDANGFIIRNVDRTKLWAVQTPQAFRVDLICRALNEVRTQNRMVTDDTAACELIGHPVRLVESLDPNPKATSPADLPYIQMLLQSGAFKN